MNESSFYDFIAEIERNPYLLKGEGKDAKVFILPIAALDEYVVRINKARKSALLETTALTPVDCHYPSVHVGQPLLYSDHLQIILKQSGTSINHNAERQAQRLLRQGVAKNKAYPEASLSTAKQLAGLPNSAYEWLLYDMNKITENGHSVDVIGDNVMASHSDLGWVDVNMTPYADPSRNFVRNVFNNFEIPFLSNDSDELMEIKEKLTQAGNKLGIPITHNDAIKRSQNIKFKKVSSVKGLNSILIREAPEEIAALLYDVRHRVGLK
jgi:hypothetical protein